MATGRTDKAIKNVAFNLINQVLTLILSFVSRTVFIWGIGVEYLGLNGIFGDVLNLLSLADLGFGTAMVYSFYKPLAENDYDKMAALTAFYKKIYTIIAVGVGVIGLILIPFLPYIVNLDNDVPNLIFYYLLSLFNVIFSYFCVYKTSILSADQKNYKIVKITMVVNIVRSILQIVSIIFFKSYIIYLVLGCVSVLINNIIATKVAEKEYPFINKKINLSKVEQKSIFSNIFSIFIYKISATLINATDNILISIIIGTISVGYYSNYLLLQNKISALYLLLFSSVTASIGHLIATEKEEKRYEIFSCEQSISFIVCGVVIPCFTLLVNDFISVWLGNEFVLDNLTVIAIGLNMYLACVLQPLWSYREATGLYRKTKWLMLICAVTNIILSIIGGILIGLAGIIFASAISRLITYIWYEPKVLFKEYFNKSPIKYYLQLIFNFVIVVALVAGMWFIPFFSVNNILQWVLKAVIIGIFSLIVIILCYFRTDGFILLKNKVASKLKRKKN